MQIDMLKKDERPGGGSGSLKRRGCNAMFASFCANRVFGAQERSGGEPESLMKVWHREPLLRRLLSIR